ncbi:protease [Gordonia phage Mollymur]|uniref:Protease n=1 Tax=Gordonia phage Mollymur TaxID=2590895 RepID=A0A4Y6E9T0_9CAUD|nr:protease [Gordonia phage Mollymur]QDF15431.1 protease [Gordonia phage Mollymur]
MTIIAAARLNGSVMIAADWAISSGDREDLAVEPKVVELKIEDSAAVAFIGVAGDASVRSIIGDLTLPALPPAGPDIKWAQAVGRLVTSTIMAAPIPPMRAYEGGSDTIDADMILVAGEKFYYLLDNGATEPSTEYAAVGCGEDYALGYLAARYEVGPASLSEVLGDCIQVVCAVQSGCGLGDREPFQAASPLPAAWPAVRAISWDAARRSLRRRPSS